jgi:hypothetical protein
MFIYMLCICICCYIYGFVYDCCMYDFTFIYALSCGIEERKSFVKYWYVLLSLPQEYVYVQNVNV